MSAIVARRLSVLALAAVLANGCAGAGAVGDILGGVLGGPAGSQGGQQQGQAEGVVTGVDTRRQQIGLQLTNGQTVGLLFDNNTRVVYQNQNYPPTALERGDRIIARVQETRSGYYTDYVQVTQSVQEAGGRTSGQVQQFAGVVRDVNTSTGQFSVDMQGGTVVVSMPYNPSRNDIDRFQRLRRGDSVRFYGVLLNNTRIELRQFN